MRLRTPVDIGLTIREVRRALGLDQQTLARRVGVSRQWIVGVEKGKRRAELGLVLRTLEALGIPLHIDVPTRAAPGGVAPESTVSVDDVIEAHRRRPDARP